MPAVQRGILLTFVHCLVEKLLISYFCCGQGWPATPGQLYAGQNSYREVHRYIKLEVSNQSSNIDMPEYGNVGISICRNNDMSEYRYVGISICRNNETTLTYC